MTERLGGWLTTLMPILEKGSAVTLLIVLVLSALTLYQMRSMLQRQQAHTEQLVNILLAEKDKRIELAAHCAKVAE